MTGKERIKAVIENKPTDRIPFAFLDGGAWAVNIGNVSFRELLELPDAGASIIVDNFTKAGVDMISAAGGFAVAFLDAIGCKSDIDCKGGTIDVHACIKDPETDIPTLDKTKVREMFENSWVFQRILHQTREIKKLIGDTMYINACLAAPFTTAGIMLGAQEIMMMMVDDEQEELFAKLLDYSTEVSVTAFEMMHEAGCDIAWFGEPISSGAMISQDMFEEYARESIQNGYDRLKDTYEYIFMHMCGNSGARVSAITDMGFAAFSVDAPVDFIKAGKDSRGEMVMVGNIGPAAPLNQGTPAEVRAAAEQAIKNIKAGGGRVILAPGCDVPVGTPFENIAAMREAAEADKF